MARGCLRASWTALRVISWNTIRRAFTGRARVPMACVRCQAMASFAVGVGGQEQLGGVAGLLGQLLTNSFFSLGTT